MTARDSRFERSMQHGERLKILFEMVPRPDGRKYVIRDLHETIGISVSNVQKILQGLIQSPRYDTLRMIADFFGVGVDYFDCDSRQECIEYIASAKGEDKQFLTLIKGRFDSKERELEKAVRQYADMIRMKAALGETDEDIDEIFKSALMG